jgi:hypothetical protein
MGSVKVEYTFEVDDPYKVLASHIIAYYRPADVLRMMEDDNFLYIQIAKETRAQDMQGEFTDCIIEDILAHKGRMEYMTQLDKLAGYYFSKLDKERLRKEIKTALEECGIFI